MVVWCQGQVQRVILAPTPILFTIPNFITAGSGQALINIISRLDRERFAPAVCVGRKGGRLDEAVDRLNIPFIEAPFYIRARPYHSLLPRVRRVASLFRPYRFKIWHSFHYGDDYTEALIARAAGATHWIFTKKNMGWGTRSWYLRALLANRIAAQNTDMMRRFFAGFPLRSKARLLPRGVDVSRFRSGGSPRLQLRQKLGIYEEGVLVSLVAHLLPVKGHPTLIAAMSEVPKAHLALAGRALDEEYQADLDRLASRLGIEERVHFLGGIDDVPALLAETDIFVLPTWARWRMEGCPVALLEAMASGLACIATDIPGSRDLVEHEHSGLLVLPENTGALAGAIQRLVVDESFRQRLGAAARQRVESRFSIEQEVSAHEKLYDEILGS